MHLHHYVLMCVQSHETKGAYLLDREASLTNHLGGTARGKKTDILLNQALGQIQQSRLVVDGDDSCSKGSTYVSIDSGYRPPDNRAMIRGTISRPSAPTGLLRHDVGRHCKLVRRQDLKTSFN